MTAVKSHVLKKNLVKIFMIFPFYATFLPSKSCFNRKLCKRKTQSKNRNDRRKIARFCAVNNVLIASFASVKSKQKPQWQPENRMFFFQRKLFMIFLLYATFLPSNHVFIASFASVKRNPKTTMTAWKSHVFFSAQTFHDFPFLCNVSAQ